MTQSKKDLIRSKLVWLGPRLLLVVVGIVVGGLVFGVRSGGAPDPHAGHGNNADAGAGGEAQATIWTCSMHPQIRQSEPGQCPICGMDLIPVSPDEGAGNGDPGRLVLSERAKALSRLRTTTVRRRSDSAAELRLLGRVEPNETTLKTITAWTGGRIDRLHVKVTGERVRAGQVIATLYSPEVLAAHQDLLVAKRQVDRMSASVPTAKQAATAALDAARERLRLLGVPDDALARMEGQDRPTRAVPIRTPFSGTVIERVATEGAYVTTGAPLYRIADLGKLWIQLDAYESDLPRLSLEQQVRVEVEAFPGEEFTGKLTFIDPTLDARRRTARVRVEVDNKDGRLRPGMFAQAVVAAGAEEGESAPLVIPSTAPLFTGRRAIVYVEVEREGVLGYEPRTVRLGPRLGHFYPVVAGLSEGERVVMRGAFTLDADLQIRGGTSMMASPDDREPGAWDAVIDVPKGELARLSPVAAAYLTVQRALAADDLAAARAAATELEKAISAAKIETPHDAKAAWATIAAELSKHARHVARVETIEDARMGFEGLSDGIGSMLRRLGNPLAGELVEAHCPMAFGSRGASWFQQGETIDNAYFGASMRTCGKIERRVEPSGHLPAKPAAKSRAPSADPAGGHAH